MIYIEKGDKVALPKEFHQRHNISVVLYDFLADILSKPRYKGLTSTKIPLDKETKRVINKINKGGIHILDYLTNNNRKDEIVTVLTKHVFMSVLHDMTSFIYESLSCARKGKMSVAYSLLRKPLTDELIILEQLLIDKEDFIDRFHFQGTPSLYDPSANNLKHDKLSSITSKAIEKVGLIGPFFKETVYDLRYNKASISGLNGMMNHAHHVVTADKNYRTEDKNLNFVFSIEEDYKRYWTHYYHFVPYLLIYTSCIVDRLAHGLVKVNSDYGALREFKRYLSMLFWVRETSFKSNKSVDKFFKLLSKALIVTCKCGNKNKLIEADYRLYFEIDAIPCTKCFENLFRTTDLTKRIKMFFNEDGS